MKLLALLAMAVASASTVFAQSVLDYSKMPACARQCTVLAQAEGGCVPPGAQVSTQATYQSCVCQSAFLTTLHSSGAVCQATGCSADDAAKITTYYNALCAGPVVEPTMTTTTSTTSAATGTGTADAAGETTSATNKGKPSWLDSHWRWVVMVVVVAAAILFFWIGGIWLKRRMNRKRDARRANMAAHDAPYLPPPPSSERSFPGILKGSSSKSSVSSTKVNGTAPTPPMTAMSGVSTGPGSMAMDGGIGGIAPPRGPSKLRSRSSTLQSLGFSNGSKATLSDPVAWGPHQHQAFNQQASSNPSVPPSPVSAVTSPPAVYRSREFVPSSEQPLPLPVTCTTRAKTGQVQRSPSIDVLEAAQQYRVINNLWKIGLI
ncbi:hypothetical protein K504DRAFT_454657 [Pleomassaria siparia CBS 279.74]|uniref:CFEM domain-containing protein n=1 Tax=Pleomassaria siparia CBS 279.74 TaxID=1314801 RepID=A0A6G1KCU1_9PLEO|nr:hypothetical protein K504DRAFT_454657 [Pleomassaria siparia CBS 279.74]